MVFQEFLQKIKETIKQQMPNYYKVEIIKITKNNNQILEGIVISNKSDWIGQNIYLNTYYQDYLQGRETDSIVNEIINLHIQAYGNISSEPIEILKVGQMDNKVTYRLVNYEMNSERLKTMPHKEICDLAKIYYIIVESDSNGTASIAITNDLIKQWDYSIEKLDKIAEMNTPHLFPPTIKTMNQILFEMLKSNSEESYKHSSHEAIEMFENLNQVFYNPLPKSNESEMYVLSNINNLNGASAMIYPNVLHDFAVSHQSNLYILPSSIHESILIPINQRLTKESLRQMVIEVNQTQVAPEEVLSNEVYYYDYKNDEVSIAKE